METGFHQKQIGILFYDIKLIYGWLFDLLLPANTMVEMSIYVIFSSNLY